MTEETNFDEGFALMFSGKDEQSKEKETIDGNNTLACILKNQVMHNISNNTKNSSWDAPQYVDSKYLTCEIFNNWGIDNLVGIQPLTGPLGMVYALEHVVQNENIEYVVQNENKDDEKLPDISGTQGRKMSLNVVAHVVEARVKPLDASVSLEAIADTKAFNALVETETYHKVSAEIAKEICIEVLDDLMDVGHKITSNAEDNIDHIRLVINRQNNEIARDTLRGSATWLVVGLNILARMIENPTFIRNTDPKNELDGSALRYVGILNGSQKIFYSDYIPYNEVLCGYKGGNGETDVGYIYSPYITVMQRGPTINPETFETDITFATRYAKKSLHKVLTETTEEDNKKITTTIDQENNYYRTITFSNISEQAEKPSIEAVNLLLESIDNKEE